MTEPELRLCVLIKEAVEREMDYSTLMRNIERYGTRADFLQGLKQRGQKGHEAGARAYENIVRNAAGLDTMGRPEFANMKRRAVDAPDLMEYLRRARQQGRSGAWAAPGPPWPNRTFDVGLRLGTMLGGGLMGGVMGGVSSFSSPPRKGWFRKPTLMERLKGGAAGALRGGGAMGFTGYFGKTPPNIGHALGGLGGAAYGAATAHPKALHKNLINRLMKRMGRKAPFSPTRMDRLRWGTIHAFPGAALGGVGVQAIRDIKFLRDIGAWARRGR